MARRTDRNYVPGATMSTLVAKMLEMLPPKQQDSYRRIISGDLEFRAAYTEADKTLPICKECGANTIPILADRDFEAEYWSRCCYAPIEQDAGREP